MIGNFLRWFLSIIVLSWIKKKILLNYTNPFLSNEEAHWKQFFLYRRQSLKPQSKRKHCMIYGKNVQVKTIASQPNHFQSLRLKVSKFQNEFMKSSFLPKYEPNILRISALYSGTLQGRNPYNFWFIFWEKRWLHKFILKFTDL